MNHFSILLLTTIMAVSAIALEGSATAVAHTRERASHPLDGEFSAVYSPEVPSSVRFAGKEISLDRNDMYERLDRELSAMSYTHGNTLLVIKRANRYFPVLLPILRQYGVPEDLIYLACIESTLNPLALSGAKAAGLWQFMPATGQEFGLEVNDYIDERYHPVKATEAAMRYLKKSYGKYGNWESVAASYNGGMARISRELEAQHQESAYDLYLTDETSRYMFRLLAMKLIMEHPSHYGYRLADSQLYQPYEYEEVTVSGPVDDWAQWAIDHGVDYRTLREYNPWIRAKSLPNKSGKTYRVALPRPGSNYRSHQKPETFNPNWTVE